MKIWMLVLLSCVLSACSQVPVSSDFDPSRIFSAYRTWSWLTPAVLYQPDDLRIKSDLTDQRLMRAVDTQLSLHGLQPASGQKADLQVQVALITEQRSDQFTTTYGAYNGYWPEPIMSQTHEVYYQIATLQIDLYDTTDGKLIWRASRQHIVPERPLTPTQRQALIEQSVADVLSQYPPQ